MGVKIFEAKTNWLALLPPAAQRRPHPVSEGNPALRVVSGLCEAGNGSEG